MSIKYMYHRTMKICSIPVIDTSPLSSVTGNESNAKSMYHFCVERFFQ